MGSISGGDGADHLQREGSSPAAALHSLHRLLSNFLCHLVPGQPRSQIQGIHHSLYFIYLFFRCESKYMQPQSLYTLLYPTFSFFFFLLYIAFGHAFSCENTSHIYSMKLGSHSDCTLTVYPDTADGNDVKY